MITPELQRKINFAVKLLQLAAPSDGSPIEIAYSGGKDSDVILQLAKEAGINYRAIYKNTTIDPPGTIRHAQDNGAEIMQPKKTFLQLIEANGLPTRFGRFCCRYLKEYKILEKVAMGIRRSESDNRARRYKEPTECKFYGSKKEHVEAIYPILDWSNADVVEFIKDRKLKIHPLYFRDDGTIDPTRRLGCVGCPMAGRNKRIEQFKEHPRLLAQIIKALRKFRATHPDVKVNLYFADEYEQVFRDIFCDTQAEFEYLRGGMFGKPDFKAFLEQQFSIKL